MKTFSKALLSAAIIALTSCGSAARISVLIGTYTDTGSEGIYACTFDQNSGRFTSAAPESFFKAENPSYLCWSEGNLYAVSEMHDSTAAILSLTFNPNELLFTQTGAARTLGEDPCYVATDGNIAVTANYSGGSLSVFKLDSDGSLASDEPSQVISGSIGGPDTTRQNTAHVHCTIFSPDKEYLLASDFSADRILVFKVAGDSLSLFSTADLESDYGPRHILFANDSLVYVIGELSGKITALNYSDGLLEPFQVIDCDPGHSRGSADIRISPDGRFLYASNRHGEDGVAVFMISDDGTLLETGYCPTAANPRNIAITPNGKYLLAGSQDEGVIQVFRRNMKTGELTLLPEATFAVEKAVCILFQDNQ